MLTVKLLKDVAEGNVDFQEAKKAAALAGRRPPMLKTVKIHGKIVGFVKGTVLTMHEAGAEKYVKRGLAEVVEVVEA